MTATNVFKFRWFRVSSPLKELIPGLRQRTVLLGWFDELMIPRPPWQVDSAERLHSGVLGRD